MPRFQGGQRKPQQSNATLQLIIKDLKTYTKNLADILQKYQHYGEKITLPDEEQERQEFCLYQMDLVPICIMEVKTGKNQLGSKTDVLKKYYRESSKMMRQAVAKEMDAL